jgi:hypothetical protein
VSVDGGKPVSTVSKDTDTHASPDDGVAGSRATPDSPRYMAWTDRWDPGTWEMPDNPTRLQRVLAGIALVIILTMTVWVPLRLLKLI